MRPEELPIKKETATLATQEDLLVDLTFHNIPASLITEFAQKLVEAGFEYVTEFEGAKIFRKRKL